MRSGQRPAVMLKIPPGNSVLRADDGGLRPQHRTQLRNQGRQSMGLHAQEDHIHGASFFKVANDPGMSAKIIIGADDADAVLLHDAQMSAARVQGHIISAAHHHYSHVRPYLARAHYQEFHLRSTYSADSSHRPFLL